MCCTCNYHFHMSTMIQIRNVPDALHRRLKSRAALAGMSLSDYLLQQIREVAERPTIEEMRARLARRSTVTLSVDTADAVRARTRQPVIVVDASALLEVLLRTPLGEAIEKPVVRQVVRLFIRRTCSTSKSPRSFADLR